MNKKELETGYIRKDLNEIRDRKLPKNPLDYKYPEYNISIPPK